MRLCSLLGCSQGLGSEASEWAEPVMGWEDVGAVIASGRGLGRGECTVTPGLYSELHIVFVCLLLIEKRSELSEAWSEAVSWAHRADHRRCMLRAVSGDLGSGLYNSDVTFRLSVVFSGKWSSCQTF